MNSSIISVSEILSNAKSFISAGFSDGYRFDNEKAAIYFEELVENSISPMPIFSGILILEKTEDNYTIIDGLQRLTTICLLMCALCENYKGTSKANEDSRNKILNRFLINKENPYEPKLSIIGKDPDIYRKILFSQELTEEEKDSNLFTTYQIFLNKIRAQKISGTDLFKIISKIQFMIIITEKTEISARDLYQAINGSKGISQINLIHDFILQQDKDSEYIWLKIVNSFQYQTQSLEAFISDFLVTRTDEKMSNKSALYNNFKNYYYKMSKYQNMQEILETIHKYSKYYLKIINADFENDNIKEQVKMLNENDGKDTYPYLMEVLEDVENSHIDTSAFLNILMMINLLIKSQKENSFSNINIDFSKLSKELNKMLILKDYIPESLEENKLTINVINNLSTFEV